MKHVVRAGPEEFAARPSGSRAELVVDRPAADDLGIAVVNRNGAVGCPARRDGDDVIDRSEISVQAFTPAKLMSG